MKSGALVSAVNRAWTLRLWITALWAVLLNKRLSRMKNQCSSAAVNWFTPHFRKGNLLRLRHTSRTKALILQLRLCTLKRTDEKKMTQHLKCQLKVIVMMLWLFQAGAEV